MTLSGDRFLLAIQALGNPHRLRIVAALHAHGRNYVSRLARDIGLSRPLLHLHLQKLQEAGLVRNKLELSPDGKALNFYELTDFDVRLSPAAIAAAVPSMTDTKDTKD